MTHYSAIYMSMNVALPKFALNGETLKEVDITKYLGHLFSDDINDDADIARQCRQLYVQGNINKIYIAYPNIF